MNDLVAFQRAEQLQWPASVCKKELRTRDKMDH